MVQWVKAITKRYDILLSGLFFILYLVLGYHITMTNESAATMNVFFYSDTGRVFSDLTDTVRINDQLQTEINHYRSLVHPVFMVLMHPIVRYLNLIFGNWLSAIVFLQSLLGAINIFILINTLKLLQTKDSIIMPLSLVYGFSFSQFIFVSQPETFLYAAFFLLLFWYLVIRKIMDAHPLNNRDILLFSVAGCLCLGITLTNFAQFLTGLFFLLIFNEKNRRRAIQLFLLITAASFSITVVLNNVQIGLWRSSGNFLVYLIDFIINPVNDEKTYIDLSITLGSIINVIKGFWGHGFIAPVITLDSEGAFLLGAYPLYSKIIIGINVFLTGAAGIYSMLKMRIDKTVLPLGLALLMNMALHLLYGNEEVFLYTQHILFLIILMTGSFLTAVRGKNVLLGAAVLLWISALFTAVVNFAALGYISDMVNSLYLSGQYSITGLDSTGGYLIRSLAIAAFLLVLPAFIYRNRKQLYLQPLHCGVTVCLLAAALTIVPVSIKVSRDGKIIHTIQEQGVVIAESTTPPYRVYQMENALLYAFPKDDNLFFTKSGHRLEIIVADNAVYARENINFNKETGSRLFAPNKSNVYHLIEIHTTKIEEIHITRETQ